MPQPPDQERSIIVRNLQKRPYGARVKFHVLSETALGSFERVTVLLDSGQYACIAPNPRKAPWEGGAKFELVLDGFATASGAEVAGRRIVQSLLWTAVELRTPIRLEYGTYEAATVYDRGRSSGIECIAFGSCIPDSRKVLNTIAESFDRFKQPNPTLILSMEIFCAAGLESSQRARFLLYVSALEPLAPVTSLGSDVTAFVEECTALLNGNAKIDSTTKNSLRGRLTQLRDESIRQALRRFLRDIFPDDAEVLSAVDRAYRLRSELIHEGRPVDLDVDLSAESDAICSVLRRVYETMLFGADG